MRRISILAVATALTFAATALAAKPAATGKPKVTAAKSQAPKPQAAKAPKAPKAPKTMTASSATTTKGASAKPAKTATTTTAAPTPTTPTTWTPTNPIAQKLSTKPNHLAKLQSVLPPGTDLNLATARLQELRTAQRGGEQLHQSQHPVRGSEGRDDGHPDRRHRNRSRSSEPRAGEEAAADDTDGFADDARPAIAACPFARRSLRA